MSKYTRKEKIKVAVALFFAVIIFLALLSNVYTLGIMMGLAIMGGPWLICKIIDNIMQSRSDRERMRRRDIPPPTMPHNQR